jgi:ribA/ribD-fused uncharacterized protein
MIITFTKVSAPYGWLGNMSPHKIEHLGRTWRTAEALFQALRFSDVDIQEAIRAERSPMAAKFVAKARKGQMVIEPGCPQDLDNMRLVLRLKIAQHQDLGANLLATGTATIIEDCTKRKASIWGAKLVDGTWQGESILGKLWMELRDELNRLHHN